MRDDEKQAALAEVREGADQALIAWMRERDELAARYSAIWMPVYQARLKVLERELAAADEFCRSRWS